jgi:hypothetical protein
MGPTDDREDLVSQLELALPPIAVEAVVIERMSAVVAENSSNVALCGNTILMLQKQVESMTTKLEALLDAYRRQSGPREVAALDSALIEDQSEPPGHAGYTVKEFSTLTKRSKSYVYRLLLEKQVIKNMAGLITHESLLKMRMVQAGKSRRPRRPKWS